MDDSRFILILSIKIPFCPVFVTFELKRGKSKYDSGPFIFVNAGARVVNILLI